MTENREDINNENRTDIKTRYEFLIAGLAVLVLCIIAFAAFRITGYLHSAQSAIASESSSDSTDGTVLIEVEIKDTEPSESTDTTDIEPSDTIPPIETVNVHDTIWIFIVPEQDSDFYRSKEGPLKLYADPVETDARRPELMETMAFQVLGFSRDGWAAIAYGGQRYYVKSSDIIRTDVPKDASEKRVEPMDTQQIRFFTPVKGEIEYVVTTNTMAFNLPDVQSSGNKVSLKTGERVVVAAVGVNWYKIIYMNADYYVLGYIEPRAEFEKKNPDFKLNDNSGLSPAGTADAVKSAISAGAALTATSLGVPAAEPDTSVTDQGDQGKNDPSKDNSAKKSDTAKKSTKSSNAAKKPAAKKTTTKKTSSSTPSGAVKELLTYVNAARKKAGVAPLKWSSGLAKAAVTRAKEASKVSKDKNAKHIRPNGKEWYTVNSKIMYAENIAWGQKSAKQVSDAWMSSSGHKANILNPDYKTFGAAVYKTANGTYYWIEEFGY